MRNGTDTGPDLTRLEWQAVSVALNDASRCGCGTAGKPGVARRLYRALTGIEGPRPLADPRLEAVRSFVGATSRRRRIAEDHVPALHDLGFNDRQVDALARLSA
ncbi:hypothetical protein ACFSGX_15200 [Sphingomonas arantia]|uniref:Uncharacterized protein n=1 Tax=Sphingomonas arantia TaxID=1460676 RepID=A0ABW4U204_9SPHN